MSLLDRESAHDIDFERWPSLVPPPPTPIRAAIARILFRRIVARTGIRVNLPDGRHVGSTDGPVMTVHNDGAFFARMGRSGKIGFGESYMAREWDSDELVEVLEAFARNANTLVARPLQVIRRWYESRPPVTEDNDRKGAVRNIARHYDLSNELFADFLDESMSYSSALFSSEDFSLEEAQAYKIERLLDVTGVRPGTRLLEIGTGWGELALRAARRGASVTSVTLSLEQATLARRRVAEAGLDSMVDIRVEDYREVTGVFDVVVSVEMIEAVGERWWPTYFSTLDRCLVPGGRVGLQSILMAHHRLEATKSSWTWIHKYIFPGGIIPSERAIRETVGAYTGLEIVDQLYFGTSYASTLKLWRERFLGATSDVLGIGFDATFQRMWEFYLAYSEAGFRSGYLDVAQFTMVKNDVTSP